MSTVKKSKISEIGIVFNGKTPSKSEQRDTGHPVLKIKDLDEFGNFRGFNSFVDDTFKKRYGSKELKANDILILNAAHSATHVGSKIVTIDETLNGVLPTGEWTVLRVNPSDVESEWLFYYLRSGVGRKALSNIVKGIHLYPKDVAELSVSLPSNDFRSSATVKLKKIEKLIRLRKESISLVDSYLRSLFLEMFGEPGKNPNGWPVVSPAEVAANVRNAIGIGPFGSNLLTSDYREDGVPLVFVRNIRERRFSEGNMKYVTDEKAKELKAHTTSARDVLMTKMGDPPGDPAVYPDGLPDAVITADCIKITVDENIIDPYFLCAMFDTDTIREYVSSMARGVAQKKINLNLFKSIQFPLPPKELQMIFVREQEKLTLLKEKLVDSKIQLENYLSSVLSETFE